ncbi:MAG: class I SAM-dependent methyltransferase [Pseudomonadota bacterium]
MSSHQNQPDWDKMAEKFDIWLPQIAPVGEALIAALQAQPGDKILDVASGTGEPALTLAQRMGNHISITGIDAAAGMVRVAQGKAKAARLSNLQFETMPAEHLSFKDNSFDKVLCRFGVMLFQDSLQGLKEMHRVLKPGGRMAIAVWGPPEKMRTLYWMYHALKDKLPDGLHPPLAKISSLGPEGVLADHLKRAGFVQHKIELHTLEYSFPTFDAYWNATEASGVIKQQFDALSNADRKLFRDEIAQFAQEFVTEKGLAVPHEWWLAVAVK